MASSKISLDLERSSCLSLPTPENVSNVTTAPSLPTKISCISNKEVIHCVGNSLRISALPSVSKSSSRIKDETVPLKPIFHDISSGTIEEYSKTKWSEYGRGYSCFEFYGPLSWVAFSRRKLNPDIHIESFPDWKPICKLSKGATIEYADISFNREGNRIAAFGKNAVDAKVWIWNIEVQNDSDVGQVNNNAHVVSPFLVIELEKLCSACNFNPSNHDGLGILFADGTGIRITKLNYILDEIETSCIDCFPPSKGIDKGNILKNSATIVDTLYSKSILHDAFESFAWELQNMLLVSTRHGSILIFDGHTANLLREVQLKQDGIGATVEDFSNSYVTKIILTANNIVLGFKNGKIECRRRLLDTSDNIIGGVVYQRDIGSSILDISVTPNFDQITVLSHEGVFLVFELEEIHIINEEEIPEHTILHESIERETKVWGKAHSSELHQSIITALCPIMLAGKAAYTVLLSGGLDGTIKVWNDVKFSSTKVRTSFRECLASLDLESPITSMSTLEGYPVFCVGTADGVIRFVHASRKKGSIDLSNNAKGIAMNIIKEEKLCSDPLRLMRYNSKVKKLAIGNCKNGSVFVLSTEPHEMNVLGVIVLSNTSEVKSLSWRYDESSFLIVGCANGIISCYDTNYLLDSEEPIPSIWSLQAPNVNGLTGLIQSSKLGDGKFIFVIHKNREGVECFKIPDDHTNAPKNTMEKVSYIESGQKEGSCMAINSRAGILVTGSYGGDVSMYKVRRNGGLDLISAYSIHVGPIITMAFSANGLCLYTSGLDGSTFIFNLTGICGYEPLQSSYEFDHLVTSEYSPVEEESKRMNHSKDESWTHRSFTGEAEAKTPENLKSDIYLRLKKIHERIKYLVSENSTQPDLEKLDRNDFIVDSERYEMMSCDIQQELDKLRLEIASIDCQNNIVVSRMKEEYWDTALVHQCQMKPFSNVTALTVYNFPTRKMSNVEERGVEIAKRLRMAEAKDMDRHSLNSLQDSESWRSYLKNHTNGHFILNSGDLDKTNLLSLFSTQETEGNKNVDGAKNVDKENEEVFDNSTETEKNLKNHLFIYNPLAVRTDRQRRSQILLLRNLIQNICSEFNKSFENLQEGKQNCLHEIEEKNSRIREIMEELDYSVESVIDPIPNEGEIPENLFDKRDCDIVPNKYNHTSNLQEREQNDDIETFVQNDDVRSRGILDMMNGTLETKKKAISEVKIERKKWMDELTKDEMSSDQKKELEEYESKLQEINALAEKERKTLEIELKKIRADINDSMNKFDDNLASLSHQRFTVKKIMLICELQIVYLEKEIFENEDALNESNSLSNELMNMKTHEEHQQSLLDKFQTEYNRLRDLLHKITDEDTNMDKSFKESIQQASSTLLDQETLKVLFQLYRNREKIDTKKLRSTRKSRGREVTKRSNLSRTSGREGSSWIASNSGLDVARSSINTIETNIDDPNSVIGSIKSAFVEAQQSINIPLSSENDPFKQLEEKSQPEEHFEIAPLRRNQLPEGFDVCDQIWSELQFLRTEKIKKEYEAKQAIDAVQSVKKIIDKAIMHKDNLISSMNTIKSLKSERERREMVCLKDPEFLVRIKQGQDEVENQDIFTDYSDVIAIPLKVIESTNESIRTVGNDKMKMLSKITKFRSKINHIKWQSDFLDLKEKDVNEQYTDWQLLRVSKHLKMVISGSQEESQHEKAARAKLQLDKREEVHMKKLSKLKREIKALHKNIRNKQQENQHLSLQFDNLTSEVENRAKIHAAHFEISEKEKNQNIKMKQIMKRRKLKDIVLSQRTDIDILKKELDRLRFKTFPSFSLDIKKNYYADEQRRL